MANAFRCNICREHGEDARTFTKPAMELHVRLSGHDDFRAVKLPNKKRSAEQRREKKRRYRANVARRNASTEASPTDA